MLQQAVVPQQGKGGCSGAVHKQFEYFFKKPGRGNVTQQWAQPIFELGPLLRNIPPARLFGEVLKLFMNGSAAASFTLLRDYRLLEHLFPATAAALDKGDTMGLELIEQTMANTDKRVRAGKPVTPAFIYAALLWPPLQDRTRSLAPNRTPLEAHLQASQDVIGAPLRPEARSEARRA